MNKVYAIDGGGGCGRKWLFWTMRAWQKRLMHLGDRWGQRGKHKQSMQWTVEAVAGSGRFGPWWQKRLMQQDANQKPKTLRLQEPFQGAPAHGPPSNKKWVAKNGADFYST